MKHLWFGVGLLTLLLIVSLWLGKSAENLHTPAARDLEKAADAALNEDWPLAVALYTRAEKHWRKHRDLTAILAHHSLIEQIDIGFAVLKDHSRCKEDDTFAASCSQLVQQLCGLSETHRLYWWNLL